MHLVKLTVPSRDVFESAKQGKLPKQADFGYVMHAFLASKLHSHAPKGFWVSPYAQEGLVVLFYSKEDAEQLQSKVCRKSLSLKSVPFPRLEPGSACHFEVYACPVIRAREKENRRGGAEIDVFLAQIEREGGETSMTRRDVYQRWLQERLEGAKVLTCRILSFSLLPAIRRTQGKERKNIGVVRPAATLAGTLEVTSQGFNQTLLRGVGRNKAFGFGLLRVYPI